jgi:putative tricarboxylic transport membrane protein
LGYLPILIGLFGLAEVIKALSRKTPETIAPQVGRIIPSFSMIKKYMGVTLTSGIIGTIIGAIPGAGPNISSFVAYDVAKRRAKEEEKKKFGNGSYAGLIASEVANNATIGGSLLPAMTMGIPGSAGAAIFMGALNLHAVVVGPAIQIENPGIMYFLYVALIVSNLFMYAYALLLIKPGVKVFTLSKELMMPLIAPLCAIGAYGANQVSFDLYIMIGAGILGFLFFKMKFPLAPFILGVILGPMADENLRKAILIFRSEHASVIDILSRPVGTILLIIIALTVYDGIFRRK